MIRNSLLTILAILFAFNEVHGVNMDRSSSSFELGSQARLSFEDTMALAFHVAKGVVEDVGNRFPSLKKFFEDSKQLIIGYPLAIVSDIINIVCSLALSMHIIQPKDTPDITKMHFQLRTNCDLHDFPILQADKLLRSPDFDIKKRVVILATGWGTNINEGNEIIDSIGKAYLCRGDTNFIAVDPASFVDTRYDWSAFNTEEIGKNIAEGLRLIAKEVSLENIHLIGHSLGAHIVGSAGRNFNYMTGKTIPRITGLDPAKPCFYEVENLGGLQRGDADFIDVIHSNSGVLGKREPTGDADFYPGGLIPLAPGCLFFYCAHGRAWEYYAETVYPGNEYNFLGRRCGSLSKLRDGKCPGKDYTMGYAVPSNLKGNYFLEVRSQAPFGKKGDQQRLLMQRYCGLCQKKNKYTSMEFYTY